MFLHGLALYAVQDTAPVLCKYVKTDLKTTDTKRGLPKQSKRYFDFEQGAITTI